MSGLPKYSKVVVIGGGVVGVSCLYHLAKCGLSDLLLIEKNELTAGSTWHAAGNVPTFSSSWAIMNMQRYSTEFYRGLSTAVGYPMNYHVTGSVRLAHSEERMMEFQRAKGMGIYQGMDIDVIGLSELKSKYPFIEIHDLKGALFDPNDGDIDPAQLTQALAKGSRDMGANIVRFCSATGISKNKKNWIVETDKGNIECEIIVNAAGYYAKRVSDWFLPFGGRSLPMAVMSHQYLLTEQIPELVERSEKIDTKLPLLRDVDSSYYLRQEKNGLNLGPYERNCKVHWQSKDDPMPDDFSFQLYPDDLERLEWYVEDAMRRVPILGKAGISKVINGPIPYTPDGNPLIGPSPGLKNVYEACVFTFGIAQGGGAGKVLSEWIAEGYTEWDMWSCDPRRFTDFTDKDYCVAKAAEVYGHEYAMHFPFHFWTAGRDKKLSPIHQVIIKNGGQMGAYNGWERANWFAKNGDETSEKSTQTWNREGPWFARVKEECLSVNGNVGVLDLPGFSRFKVEGLGASEFLLGKISGNLPSIGRMNLAYFPDERGRVLTEMSVMRHEINKFTLITAGAAQWHDCEILKSGIKKNQNVKVSDITNSWTCLIVTGPNSRALMSRISNADLALPWLSLQNAVIQNKQILLARVSYAGELGWEIHAKTEDISFIYDKVLEEGAIPFGMYALDSLRVEKGYRAWKGDLSTDYTLLESGLERFIRFDKKEDFPGKQSLLAEKQRGSVKKFVTMIIKENECDAPYMSTIWHDGQIVGEVTSGAYGHRVNASIALGMVKTDLAISGQNVSVDIFGNTYPAIIQNSGPLWDPQNEALKI
ncbi:MAG: FAD-dependent oxidoreductase [Paracoccaceae bacterium]